MYDFLLTSGGEVRTNGAKPKNSDGSLNRWKVGIRHPRTDKWDSLAGIIQIQGSGSYFNFR